MTRYLAALLLVASCAQPALAQTAPANVQMLNGVPRAVTPVTQVAGPNLATAQVAIGTTSTLLTAARSGRIRVILTVGAANTCAFGNAGVTLASGFPLQPVAGATLTLDTQAAVYAVCSAVTTVSYVEMF